MLTASHNPARYNGIKLCLAGASPVGQDSGLAEIRRVAEGVLESAPADGGVEDSAADRGVEHADLIEAFAAHVRSFIDPAALRHLKVVADTANGMGGLVAPRVFEGLPFDVEILFGELDGNFPNHPADPIQPENLASLREGSLRRAPTSVSPSTAMPTASSSSTRRRSRSRDRSRRRSWRAAMLEKHPGSTILYNLICSKAVPEIVAERGGVPVRTRVGHSFIKALMAETGAVFGGEHSGHYYFRENYRADSGIIAALVVLEVIVEGRRPALGAAQALRALRRLRRDQHRGSATRRRLLAGVAEHYAATGCRPRPPRRAHRRPRRVVVQPAALEHRAAAAPEPRSAGRSGSAPSTWMR